MSYDLGTAGTFPPGRARRKRDRLWRDAAGAAGREAGGGGGAVAAGGRPGRRPHRHLPGDQIVDIDDQLAVMVAMRDEGKIGAIGLGAARRGKSGARHPSWYRLRPKRVQPAEWPRREHARPVRRAWDRVGAVLPTRRHTLPRLAEGHRSLEGRRDRVAAGRQSIPTRHRPCRSTAGSSPSWTPSGRRPLKPARRWPDD